MKSRLGLLLWLRFRMLNRRRTKAGWVGFALVVLLLGIPLAGGGAVLLYFVTRWLAAAGDTRRLAEWVRLVLFFVWLLLLIRPIVTFGANEFYDITKLFHFPVDHRTVFTAQTLGMLASGSALFFLPALLALGVALPGGALAATVRILVLLLFLFHGVALGQLVQLTFLNLLRSRRFRDFAVILSAVLSGGFYLVFRVAGDVRDPAGLLTAFLDRHFSVYTAPLPSYWTAGALLPGSGVASWLLFLLGFLPVTAGIVLLAAILEEKAFQGEIAPEKTKPVRRGGASDRGAGFPLSLLPDDVRAVAGKELSLLRREPMVKSNLIQQLAFFLVPIGLVLFSEAHSVTGAIAGVSSWLVYPLLLVESVLVLNLFGLEGGGIVTTALTPASRDRILLGKIVAYLGLFEIVNVAAYLVFAAVAVGLGHPLTSLALVLSVAEATAGLFVLAGIGAVVSVLAPVRFTARGRGALAQGQTGREGCGVAVLRMFVLLVLMLLLAPVAILSRIRPSLLLGGVGLAYSFGILMAGWRIGAGLLESREARILSTLARSPD